MPKFIVFEGLENLGKTTKINLLKKVLPSDSFVFTSCPGGSESAKQIRAVLADKMARETMTKETEVLLYAASHADVSHGVITPALSAGKHVICDRYYHSALAYQGGLKGHSEENLLLLHEKFSGNLQPNIVLYLFGEQLKNIVIKMVTNVNTLYGLKKFITNLLEKKSINHSKKNLMAFIF